MPKLLVRFDPGSNRLLILEDGQLDLAALGDTSALRRSRVGRIEPSDASPALLEVTVITPDNQKKKLPKLFVRKRDAVAAETEEAKRLYFQPLPTLSSSSLSSSSHEDPSDEGEAETESPLAVGQCSVAPCPFCRYPLYAVVELCSNDPLGNQSRAIFKCNCP